MPGHNGRAFLLHMLPLMKSIYRSMRTIGLVVLCAVLKAHAVDLAVSDDGSKSEQSRPRIAVANNTGFVVVWEDKRGGKPDVFFQRFDEFGYAVGLNQRLTDDTAWTVRKQPSIAVDYAGQYQSAWLDYRTGAYPLSPQIFGQILDSTGSPIGANSRLTVESPDSLRSAPDVALSPNGDGLLVWEDYRNRNWDIYAQRIDASGGLVGPNFKINDDQNNAQQHAPRVAASSEGWFVVTWYDNRMANDDIFVQRLSTTGGKLGANLKINSDAGSSRQAFPDIATDGAGHFTVVWTDWRNGTYPNNSDIYARKFDTTLVAITSDTRVNRDGSLRSQKDPSISADRLGNVGIVWSDSGSTSFDIAGQMIDADGKVREANFRGNASTDSSQLLPDIALDGRKRYVCWTDYRNGNWDIYASVTLYNNPTLVASPGSISFAMETGKPLPADVSVVLNHTGYNRLMYRAKSSADWLSVSPDSGSTVDTVVVSITNGALPVGVHTASITLIDLLNQDSSVSIPVVFTRTDPNLDTVRVGFVQISAGSSGGIPVSLNSADSVDLFTLSLKITPPETARIDSFTVDSSLGAGITAQFSFDSVAGATNIVVTCDSQAFIPSGLRVVGHCWVTGLAIGFAEIVKAGEITITTTAGQVRSPIFQPGEIQVDEATDVDNSPDLELPSEFSLLQNYPNPFNGFTTIAFDSPVAGRATVEIYNILGQEVITLLDTKVTAGRVQVQWDGRGNLGRELPSGVYFYRLKAGAVSIVRKMIFLK